MPPQAPPADPETFADARARFHAAVHGVVGLSVHLSGTPSSHGRQYWSLILLSKMTLTSMTLNRIIPKTGSAQSTDLWDLGSVAALVRTLAENYLLMFWLCVEPGDEDTWQFRIAALTIADNRARYRMTAEVEGQPEPEDFVAAQRGIAEKIADNPVFRALDAGARREILKGARMPFIQDDVVGRLALDQASFRSLYRYLSSFVHTGTVSFFRMEQHRRGNGEFNDYEANAMVALMEFSLLILDAAIADAQGVHGLGDLATGPEMADYSEDR